MHPKLDICGAEASDLLQKGFYTPRLFLGPCQRAHTALQKKKSSWSLGFVSSVPENPGKIGWGHGLPSMNDFRPVTSLAGGHHLPNNQSP